METLHAQTVLDHLTGLRSQRALWRELTQRTATCSTASPLAVVMVDFDLFDEVNARHGHDVGDAVLRRAAAVVQDVAPSPRLAFRYGGEEFVVLVPGDADDGWAVAECVREQIAQQNGGIPAVTVSCGVAALDAPVEPWVALDRADAAVRDAKRAGRDRVVVAGMTRTTESDYLLAQLDHEAPRRAALALAVATVTAHESDEPEDIEDVLTLCEALGRRMSLEGAALDRLLAGAHLHDVGKVAVPPEILNKAGTLTDDERAIVGEHTVIGEGILRSVPEMAEVATIVRHSHEHWDGSGYPDGLHGEQIPLASRIILCADAFHAIRSDRPYRPGRPADEAIAELRDWAGTQFDPAVVKALVDVAENVRREAADPAVVTALPRSRRLATLLLALTLTTGTAFAAIPEVRDLIRSIFGADPGPSDVVPDEPSARGFDFGPLGDILSIKPIPARETRGDRGPRGVVPLAEAVRETTGRDGAPAPQQVFEPEDAGGPPRGPDRGGPTPDKTPGTPKGKQPDAPAPPGGGPGTPPGNPPAPAPQTGGGPGPVTSPGPGSQPAPGGQPGGGNEPGGGTGTGEDPPPEPPPPPGTDPPPESGKGTPPRRPEEIPRRDDEAKEPGAPGRPEDPGRKDPPGGKPD